MIRVKSNELTQSQLYRAVQSLDANHDQRISGNEVGFPPNQLDLIAGAPAGDGVDLSRVATSLGAGMTTLSLNGNYRASRDLAASFDTNGNGFIDKEEVALSDALKSELTGSTDKPVSAAQLANGFWKGTVTLGRELRLY